MRKEILLGLAAGLWAALVLVAYDIARVPPVTLPRPGGLSHLLGVALLGLAHYAAAAVGAMVLLALGVVAVRRRRASNLSGPAPLGALPLYAGAAGAALAGVTGLCVLAERRGAASSLTASWLIDAQIVGLGALAAGWGAAALVAASAGRPRRGMWIAALAVGPILPAIVAGAPIFRAADLPAPRRAPAREGLPDVFLIVADTLRADGLRCYSPAAMPTPEIDALASKGARFTDTTAQASWTNPATAAILTGLLPSDSGMFGHHGRIHEDVRTLAESLAAHGYDTAGITANPLVSRAYGFDRGFRHWDQDPDHRAARRHPYTFFARMERALGLSWPESQPPRAAEMVDRALSVVGRARRAPLFLYLHLMDPHDPYDPPADLAREADPGYEGRLRFHPGTLYGILRGEIEVDAADLAHAHALYRADVASMDRDLGRLLDALRGSIEEGRAVVVVTSDHGEEFMEHGSLGHEHTLYQELIQIPLIVVRAGSIAAGSVVSEPARQIDIVPTILDLAGLPADPALPGRSLVPLTTGGAGRGAPTTILSEEDFIGYRTASHQMRAAREKDWKVILYSPNVFGIGRWRREVFDLASDPGETAPVSEAVPETAPLEARLAAWIAGQAGRDESPHELDPETERRLRALGYVQ